MLSPQRNTRRTGSKLLLQNVVIGLFITSLMPLSAWSVEGPWDTKFFINNGPNLRIQCTWNARERAAGSYSPEEWPRGALATQRALLFAARQVLRDEWDINQVIASEHPGGGHAQLAEAETNFLKEHTDYPPHIHINFIWPEWSGHVNTHFTTTEDGKVRKPWLIWKVPGCEQGPRYPAAGEWWPELDRKCRAVWWQSWTAEGAIQLKRTQTADVYRLLARDIQGDLSGADVYLGKNKIYSVDITEYDPVRLHMIVRITDFKSRKIITETFKGDPVKRKTLVSHDIVETAMSETSSPVSTPAEIPRD
ncbi:MAG: hypothetical protein JXM79_21445 [Sedimentisphaerales bacterium]|nr:hypothetical protein [Sedimentisphaerales bacterium]